MHINVSYYFLFSDSSKSREGGLFGQKLSEEVLEAIAPLFTYLQKQQSKLISLLWSMDNVKGAHVT